MESPIYTVVIADDVEGLRRLLRLVLEDCGRFRVIAEVGDGLLAVDAVRRLQPDVLLLDIAMPRMSGLQALPIVLQESPRTKVVVVSGLDDAKLAKQSLELGASAFILKGDEPERVVDRVLAVLEATSAPAAMEGVP